MHTSAARVPYWPRRANSADEGIPPDQDFRREFGDLTAGTPKVFVRTEAFDSSKTRPATDRPSIAIMALMPSQAAGELEEEPRIAFASLPDAG
jgi:hypothetical protein